MKDATEDSSEYRFTSPEQVAQPLVDALATVVPAFQRSLFVAIDGRSGAGKSTLAAAVAKALTARSGLAVTVIEGDEFYAGGTAERWDERAPAEKADQVIDWRRQHQVLHDLRSHGSVSWYPFDWEATDWDSDRVPVRATPRSCTSTEVVILEGAYSARPELHDVLDVLVLLDTSSERRRRQLLDREGDEYRADWEARWSAAEEHYFGVIMPPDKFNHVL